MTPSAPGGLMGGMFAIGGVTDGYRFLRRALSAWLGQDFHTNW